MKTQRDLIEEILLSSHTENYRTSDQDREVLVNVQGKMLKVLAFDSTGSKLVIITDKEK
jgi:hypothetical protein